MFLLRTRVLWLATSLLLTVSDRTWGQTPADHSTVILSIEENSQAETEVGALAELYPELNHFRFSNRSRTTLFQVHPDTGVISVRDGARLDFEKRPVVTLTIIADIREEQDDPYLAEFADSLRDEGFSSKTLSRLLPLEQRIHVQVQLRNVEETDEAAIAADSGVRSESAFAVDESDVVPVVEPSGSEATSETTLGNLDATQSVMSENGSPGKAIPEIQNSVNELPPPATQQLTPESTTTVEPVRIPEVAAPLTSIDSMDEETTEGTDDTAEPTPADDLSVAEESSTENGKILSLSETSGQTVLQLNGVVAGDEGNAILHSADTAIDQAVNDAEIKTTEIGAHPQSAFLLRGLVSLLVILGTAYLLWHRCKSLRKSLPELQEEFVAESSASNELISLTADVSSDDQAEAKAADEFVKEMIPEEPAPQLENAIKAVITQRSDDDNGAPFDPESLFNDEYLNDSDDLQSLKAGNAELVERLEALAGAVESAPGELLRINGLPVVTRALSDSVSAVLITEGPAISEDYANDSDFDFVEGSNREDRSELVQGRRNFSTCDQGAAPLVAPRWNSDWPSDSVEKSSASAIPSTEAVAVLVAEPGTAAVNGVTDEIASLRNELADLFAIQKKTQIPETKPARLVPSKREDVEEFDVTAEKADETEPCPEETHLESVAQYLSQLLERSKKEEAADAIFVDRRKPIEKPAGKWDGVDRRGGGQKAKTPVKSYIESYLSEHGGELSHDSGLQNSSETASDELSRPSEPKPMAERRPVDVQEIRQRMNSFRNVASTALEHALASHRIRQAKGKVAWRTTLIFGLAVVSALAIATTSATKTYFPSMGWLMGLFICLVIAELILRVGAIRRHRRELRNRILESAKKSGDRSDKNGTNGIAVAEHAQVIVSR